MQRRGRPSRGARPREASGLWLTAALRRGREDVGMTREALSAASGVPVSTLAKIEQSRSTDPGFLAVAAVAEALGLGLDELAAGARLAAPTLC